MDKNSSKSGTITPLAGVLVSIAGLIVYTLHASIFSHWLIDDAGISLAYAQNLVNGHGLVAQPGQEPVEGYSNFLWVMILAFFYLIKLMDVYLTTKIVSGLLVGGLFLIIYKSVALYYQRPFWIALSIALLLSINPSFVIWTTSGLENGLYAFLAGLLFYAGLLQIQNSENSPFPAYLAGIAAAAMALTRPDGLIYAAFFPAMMIFTTSGFIKHFKELFKRNLFRYITTYFIILVAFILFRITYFGDYLPNTYYAKVNTGFESMFSGLLNIGKLQSLLTSISPLGVGVLVIFVASFIFLIIRKKISVILAASGVFLLIALLQYLLLPTDWMGEYRFATIFFVFIFTFGTLLIIDTVRSLFHSYSKYALILILIIYGWAAIPSYTERSYAFADNPTVPLEMIKTFFADRFNQYAEELNLENASFLTPDLGGNLLYSNLEIFDMAGLCDKKIARTFFTDNEAFHNYVFEVLKPDFIRTHHYWTVFAAFDRDERFRENYVPLKQFVEESLQQYAKEGDTLFSGEFVRLSSIENNPSVLEKLDIP